MLLTGQPPVRLHWLRVGHCVQYEALARAGAPWRRIQFPAYAGAIEHPEHGWMLVDTGYASHFFDATRRLPERLYRMLLPVSLPTAEELPGQLRRLGVEPSEIRRVLLTHFHGDHVAGIRDYPAARFTAAGAGLGQLRSLGPVAATSHGLLPGLLPADFEARFDAAEELPLVSLDGTDGFLGRDLLGDRSVILLELPGHTPGHLGVLLTTATGQVLLAGDAAWSQRAVAEDTPPSVVALSRFHDPAATRRTLHGLHRLHRRDPEVLVLPSHCSDAARAYSER